MADSSEQTPAEMKHEGSETPGLAAEGANAPVASEPATEGTRQLPLSSSLLNRNGKHA